MSRLMGDMEPLTRGTPTIAGDSSAWSLAATASTNAFAGSAINAW